jgi:peptide/nickel transport system permease protein
MLKRVFWALPTLLIVTLIVFGLNKCTPGDTVRLLIPYEGYTNANDELALEHIYKRDAVSLGLEKPLFYCSITSAAEPDTLNRILLPERKKRMCALLSQTGNWVAVQNYDIALQNAAKQVENLPDSLYKMAAIVAINDLKRSIFLQEIDSNVVVLKQNDTFKPLLSATDFLRNNTQKELLWKPKFLWHGAENQYHFWLKNICKGNFGDSYLTHRPVGEMLRSRLGITLTINGLSLFFAYLLAIPLGIYAARFKGKFLDNFLTKFLVAIYAMPVFWLGTLLIYIFASANSGFSFINGISIGSIEDMNLSTLEWLHKYLPRLILPILTLMLHTLAVLALQMRSGILEAKTQDYFRTARAKGLTEKTVFNKHAFRNALFPLITIFGSVFPQVFAGSFLIEFLFNIQGMGLLSYDAFMGRDYPVLFAVLLLSSFLTISGILMSDVLYRWADPRVASSED